MDDLREGDGSNYIQQARTILIFVSEGYFSSLNCMRELLRACLKQKPIVTLCAAMATSKTELTSVQAPR